MPTIDPAAKEYALKKFNLSPDEYDIDDNYNVIPKATSAPATATQPQPIDNKPSLPMSFGLGTTGAIGPLAGGALGMLAASSFIPGVDALTIPLQLGIYGAAGLGGGILGGMAQGKAEPLLLGEQRSAELNQLRSAAREAHPWAYFGGEMAPQLLLGKPDIGAIKDIAGLVPRGATAGLQAFQYLKPEVQQAAKMMAAQAGLGAAQGVAGELISGEPLDWSSLGRIGAMTATGGLLSKPTRLGEALLGGKPAESKTPVKSVSAAELESAAKQDAISKQQAAWMERQKEQVAIDEATRLAKERQQAAAQSELLDMRERLARQHEIDRANYFDENELKTYDKIAKKRADQNIAAKEKSENRRLDQDERLGEFYNEFNKLTNQRRIKAGELDVKLPYAEDVIGKKFPVKNVPLDVDVPPSVKVGTTPELPKIETKVPTPEPPPILPASESTEIVSAHPVATEEPTTDPVKAVAKLTPAEQAKIANYLAAKIPTSGVKFTKSATLNPEGATGQLIKSTGEVNLASEVPRDIGLQTAEHERLHGTFGKPIEAGVGPVQGYMRQWLEQLPQGKRLLSELDSKMTDYVKNLQGDEKAIADIKARVAEYQRTNPAAAPEEALVYVLNRRLETNRAMQAKRGAMLNGIKRLFRDIHSAAKVRRGTAGTEDMLNTMEWMAERGPGYWESGQGVRDLARFGGRPEIADFITKAKMPNVPASGVVNNIKQAEDTQNANQESTSMGMAGNKQARDITQVAEGNAKSEEGVAREGEQGKEGQVDMVSGHPVNIDTPEFKKWFEGSKVVDSEGKPLVVYHGSRSYKPIKSFNSDRGGTHRIDTGWYGDGYYFTDNPRTAEEYASATGELNEEHGPIYPVYLSLKNPASLEDVRLAGGDSINLTKAQSEKVKQNLINKGFDGIALETRPTPYADADYNIVDKPGGYSKFREIVAFYPEQIKSIYNSGKWSPDNPDIMMAHPIDTADIPSDEKHSIYRWFTQKSPLAGAVDRTRPTSQLFANTAQKFYNHFRGYGGLFNHSPTQEMITAEGAGRLLDGGYLKTGVSANAREAMTSLYADKDAGTISETGNKVVDEIKNIFREKMKQVGLLRNEYATKMPDAGLRLGKLSDTYVPEMLRQDLSYKLSKDPLSPEAQEIRQKMYDHWVKVGGKEAADKAMADFTAMRGTTSPADTAGHFGPLDDAAGMGLPADLRETDPYRVMRIYGDRVARRFAYADSFGNLTPEQRLEIDSAKSNNDVKAVHRDITGQFSQSEPWVQSVAGLVRSMDLQTLTGLKNVANAMIVPWRSLKLTDAPLYIAKMSRNWREAYKETFAAGVNRHNVVSQVMGDGEIVAQTGMRRFRDLLSTVTGYNAMERVQRFANYLTAKSAVDVNVSRLQAGRAGKQEMNFLNQFADKEMIESWKSGGPLTNEQAIEVAARAVEDWQGAYNMTELPAWAMHGTLSPYFAMARWNLGQLNRFNKHVIGPALLDKNYWPLINSTLGVMFGGAAVNWLQKTITGGKKEKFATGEEIKAKIDEQGLAKAMPDMAYRAAALASLAGISGLYADVAKMTGDFYNKNYVTGYHNISIDALTQNIALFSDLRNAMQRGDTIDVMDVIAKFAENSFQNARLVMSNFTEEGKEKVARTNKMRDLRVFEQMHGMPVTDINTVTGAPYFAGKEAREFKREKTVEGSVQKGQKLVEDTLAKARREDGSYDYEKLQRDLRGLKINSYQTFPSPENRPLAFQSYADWLARTQGSEEAKKRQEDYIYQTQLNRAKSSLIPSLGGGRD